MLVEALYKCAVAETENIISLFEPPHRLFENEAYAAPLKRFCLR